MHMFKNALLSWCASAFKLHRKRILVDTFAIMDSDSDNGQPTPLSYGCVTRRGYLHGQ
jgi:hypothetical protein